MTTQNAIKKITKAGYKVEAHEGTYSAIIGSITKSVLRFRNQNGTVTNIGVRPINDHSDTLTDYCAFTFYDNITQALKCN